MDSAKQREIARKGGQAAHRSGRAHEFDSREASEAGRKGGQVVSRDRAHMARIGALGGRARGLAHQRALQQAAGQQTSGNATTPAVPQIPPTLN
jgi:general stress protein YciG